MILLDTDIFTLLMSGHSGVRQRVELAEDEVAITVITRIEVLQGRFDFLLKASDATQLQEAMARLAQSDSDLAGQHIVPMDALAAAEFARVRQNRKLKKIGRPDILIACIALANRALLVTRNLRHFKLVPNLLVENWAD